MHPGVPANSVQSQMLQTVPPPPGAMHVAAVQAGAMLPPGSMMPAAAMMPGVVPAGVQVMGPPHQAAAAMQGMTAAGAAPTGKTSGYL